MAHYGTRGAITGSHDASRSCVHVAPVCLATSNIIETVSRDGSSANDDDNLRKKGTDRSPRSAFKGRTTEDEHDKYGRSSAGVSPRPDTVVTSPEKLCPWCDASHTGRRLVVALDGTLNQFGHKNSNVVEISRRIEKNEEQLTYYASGVGTYAVPSYWSWWRRARKALNNVKELAFALRFSKIILRAYRWLAGVYQPGDQIYLFGFSPGAYQVRVLAAMIDLVGLVYEGNREQTAYAYQLYEHGDIKMCKPFKEAFCHRDARVHFVGVWDTVSSIGVFRARKTLPLVDDCSYICHFRHALALDECRVRFSPEEIFHFEGRDRNSTSETSETTTGKDKAPDSASLAPQNLDRVKEVWFAGSHSDVGGGNKENTYLLMEDLPAIWMANEAHSAGLKFVPSTADVNLKKLYASQPVKSLSSGWHLLEFLPFLSRQRDFPKSQPTRWKRPHHGAPRFIKRGQLIHASVLFKNDYNPMARCDPDDTELSKLLSDILAKCPYDEGCDSSIAELKKTRLFELDIYDTTENLSNILVDLKNSQDENDTSHAVTRLLTMIRNGCDPWDQLLLLDDQLPLHLKRKVDEVEDPNLRSRIVDLLSNLRSQGPKNSRE